MLSIGEFSKICEVSTKTLRYYDEIGLINPSEINSENGYRYYSAKQLKTMLFINRLKQYKFSLEEIKEIIKAGETQDDKLDFELQKKKKEILKQLQTYIQTIEQLNKDIDILKQGKSIMSYLNCIDIELVEVATMHLISIRRMVQKNEFIEQYKYCFTRLLKKIQHKQLVMSSAPMVLFHDNEFSSLGLDSEFAIPIEKSVPESRSFQPGLCLKTILYGTYVALPSVYAKQYEWAEKNGYKNNGALYEVYITDPSEVLSENELITEIYYPVKKI